MNMKKNYITPIIEVIEMDADEMMRNHSTGGKPGHGYGDDRDHTGPPGHNHSKSLNCWEDDCDEDNNFWQ